MNIFQKFINKIKGIFHKKQLESSTLYRLDEPKDISDYEVDSEIENKKTTMKDDFSDDKKEAFFDMYEAYKDKKIDPNNILITDLLDIGLMLSEHQSILTDKIENMEKKINLQEKKLEELVHQESELKKQIVR